MKLRAPIFLAPFHERKKRWADPTLLAECGFNIPCHAEDGELWLASDMERCESPLRDEPGRHLGDLMAEHREEILGAELAAREQHFPLLVKLLMAGGKLSIQVHPDTPAALELRRLGVLPREVDRGKHEAWWILGARPTARLYRGLCAPVTKDAARADLHERCFNLRLREHQPRPDELYDIAPGTIHGLIDGVLVLEVQQRCNVTFRLHDWFNTDTELHIEEALAVADLSGGVSDYFANPEQATAPPFALERIELQAGERRPVGSQTLPEIIVLVRGAAAIRSAGQESPLRPGDTVLWPAALPAGEILSTSGASLLHTFPRIV